MQEHRRRQLIQSWAMQITTISRMPHRNRYRMCIRICSCVPYQRNVSASVSVNVSASATVSVNVAAWHAANCLMYLADAWLARWRWWHQRRQRLSISAAQHPQHLYNLHNGTRKMLAAQIQIQQLQILATLTHSLTHETHEFRSTKAKLQSFRCSRKVGVEVGGGRGSWAVVPSRKKQNKSPVWTRVSCKQKCLALHWSTWPCFRSKYFKQNKVVQLENMVPT